MLQLFEMVSKRSCTNRIYYNELDKQNIQKYPNNHSNHKNQLPAYVLSSPMRQTPLLLYCSTLQPLCQIMQKHFEDASSGKSGLLLERDSPKNVKATNSNFTTAQW